LRWRFRPPLATVAEFAVAVWVEAIDAGAATAATALGEDDTGSLLLTSSGPMKGWSL
jgi:hypothetical protein